MIHPCKYNINFMKSSVMTSIVLLITNTYVYLHHIVYGADLLLRQVFFNSVLLYLTLDFVILYCLNIDERSCNDILTIVKSIHCSVS